MYSPFPVRTTLVPPNANLDALRPLLDYLRAPRPEHDFYMWTWGRVDQCGTVGCLAGTMVFLTEPDDYIRYLKLEKLAIDDPDLLMDDERRWYHEWGDISKRAAAQLGLDESDPFIRALFTPGRFDGILPITRERAIIMLEHLLATRELNWDVNPTKDEQEYLRHY